MKPMLRVQPWRTTASYAAIVGDFTQPERLAPVRPASPAIAARIFSDQCSAALVDQQPEGIEDDHNGAAFMQNHSPAQLDQTGHRRHDEQGDDTQGNE